MNFFLAAFEVLFLARLISKSSWIEHPVFAGYLAVEAGVYFSYSLGVSSWLTGAAFVDVFRLAIVVEGFLLTIYSHGKLDMLLTGLCSVLSGGILASAAAFDARFGLLFLVHLRILAFLAGAVLGLLLIAWRWDIPTSAHLRMLAVYLVVIVSGPVAQYFVAKFTWRVADGVILALKMVSIGSFWWLEDQSRIRRLMTKTRMNTIAALHKILSCIRLSIASAKVPKPVFKPLDPLG